MNHVSVRAVHCDMMANLFLNRCIRFMSHLNWKKINDLKINWSKFDHRYLHNDVIDGDMDELDKEANEAHNSESDSSCESDLLEFLSIGFGAFFDKSERIF